MAGDGAVFLQDPPHLGNQWTEDGFLRDTLRRLLPADTFRDAEPDLGGRRLCAAALLPSEPPHPPSPVCCCGAERFGWHVATRVKLLGRAAEVRRLSVALQRPGIAATDVPSLPLTGAAAPAATV